jgi:phosphatidylinositol glycan class T
LDDRRLASFRFVTNGTFTSHHTFFPRSLAQILEHSGARELHLKFSLGRWDAERWGAQIWDGKTGGGTGVELWAWVEADDDTGADKRWTTLTNALSGLFCASLNFIDSTRTIRPVMSFQPDGHHSPETLERLHLLHGSLPREPVCTENLTPFLKLLPCKGRAGISTLLDGHKLFDAQWQSMSIDVKPVCGEEGTERRCMLQVEQSVDMVLDIGRSLQRRDSPVPKPLPLEMLNCDPERFYGIGDACFPQNNVADLPWSLSEIFGRPITGYCPLAVPVGATEIPAHVCAIVPEARPIFISQDALEIKYPDGRRCFVLPDAKDFDIIIPQQSPPLSDTIPTVTPPLYASRSFTGHGQERGGVQAVLRNPSPTETVEFVYLESLPWFMKPYLHTLSARLEPPSNTTKSEIITSLFYRPVLDRRRGTHLEASLAVPPSSTVYLTYDFEKAVLRYTEYPPDANRGFDIAPAMITIKSGDRKGFSIRTTSLLLSLPTPDFSMPYNVIILSSTVMALAFGSIFNLLVRRFVGADEVPERRIMALRGRLVEVVRRAVGRIGGRIGGKKKVE